MSGYTHNTPFRHYHRKEDGSVYFVLNGEITSAPNCSGPGAQYACMFDVDGPAIAVKDWEAPSEFEPYRREVEQALGLPITLNQQEKVRDAINAMACEWKADYDFPDFLAVYPRESGLADDDGICWCFGIDRERWVGNDRMQQNSTTLTRGINPHDIVPVRPTDDPQFIAERIIAFMRINAQRRAQWLSNFVEQCVSHIEKTSATSPESTVGQWAQLKGWDAYNAAQPLVNTWRQR